MNQNDPGLDIEKIADWMTEATPSNLPQDSSQSLLTPTAQKARLRLEIIESLKSHFASIATGIDFMIRRMQQMTEGDEPKFDKQLFEKILTKLAERRSEEFTDEELTALFAVAVDIYNDKEFDRAADAFYVMTEFDPGQELFWKWLGNARFHAGKFKEAIAAYAMSIKLNEKDPESRVFQAHCLEIENRIPEAIDTLCKAQEAILQDSQFAHWNETVSALIEDLKNR